MGHDLRGGAVRVDSLDFGDGIRITRAGTEADGQHLLFAGLTRFTSELQLDLGIALGVQGTVTQETSKATGVTLSQLSGVVTMDNAQLNDDTTAEHTVTNTLVAASDVIIVCQVSGNTAGAYTLTVDGVGAGSFDVSLRNHSGGNLSEAVIYNFIVIKTE